MPPASTPALSSAMPTWYAQELPAGSTLPQGLRGARPRRSRCRADALARVWNSSPCMIDLGWSAPTKRLDAGAACGAILAQHQRIRGLLDRARNVAEAALDGVPPSPDAVASAIGDIRTIMEVHLAFEEKSLLPILRDDPPLGPQRAA